MNDSKTVLPSGVRLREKCEIPGCGKQVLYLGRHIKNIHKMGMSSYRAKIKSDAEKRLPTFVFLKPLFKKLLNTQEMIV